MQKLKNEIIKSLKDHIGINVVPTDTADRKPGYPYLSYKITTPMSNASGFSLVDRRIPSTTPGQDFDPDNVEVVRKEQPQFTLSISTHIMDDGEAMEKAIQAADWFRFVGYYALKDLNVVVVSVSNIGDRTVQIVDDYERRYGFDVRLRAARGVSVRLETINTYALQDTVNKE